MTDPQDVRTKGKRREWPEMVVQIRLLYYWA